VTAAFAACLRRHAAGRGRSLVADDARLRHRLRLGGFIHAGLLCIPHAQRSDSVARQRFTERVAATVSNGAVATLVVVGMAVGLTLPMYVRDTVLAASARRQ
jgi:hypothetical protein